MVRSTRIAFPRFWLGRIIIPTTVIGGLTLCYNIFSLNCMFITNRVILSRLYFQFYSCIFIFNSDRNIFGSSSFILFHHRKKILLVLTIILTFNFLFCSYPNRKLYWLLTLQDTIYIIAEVFWLVEKSSSWIIFITGYLIQSTFAILVFSGAHFCIKKYKKKYKYILI